MTTQHTDRPTMESEIGRPSRYESLVPPGEHLPPRIYKAGFVRAVADRSGLSLSSTDRVLDAILAELAETVLRRQDVVLPGFGRFYLQMHRGHVARFGGGRLDDYPVLKFSASKTMNKTLVQDLGAPARLSPGA